MLAGAISVGVAPQAAACLILAGEGLARGRASPRVDCSGCCGGARAIVIRNIPAGLGRRGRQRCVKHGIVHGRLPASMSRAVGRHTAAPRCGQRRWRHPDAVQGAGIHHLHLHGAAHTALKHNEVAHDDGCSKQLLHMWSMSACGGEIATILHV